MTPSHRAAAGSVRRNLRPLLLMACVLGLARTVPAGEAGPQSIVRQFCEADGLGRRVHITEWNAVAPLVAWRYEPAWDQVVLVGSYEVGSPRGLATGGVGVDVGYTVIGQLSGLGLDTNVHVETVTFELEAADGRWRIAGPPPPPHIFYSRVDVERMRRSLEAGDVDFVPNTVFVWWMLRSAGWNVPLVATPDLLSGETYRVVSAPKPGDVVVYLRTGVPYHVGLLEADDAVVSSTLNAGIVRSPTAAFAGDVQYFRLVQPEPEVKAPPVPTPVPAMTAARPSAGRTPAAGTRRTPGPAVRQGKRHAAESRPSLAQRSKKKRVTGQGRKEPGAHRTPSATREIPQPHT